MINKYRNKRTCPLNHICFNHICFIRDFPLKPKEQLDALGIEVI